MQMQTSSSWKSLKDSFAEFGLTPAQVAMDVVFTVFLLIVLFIALFLAVEQSADVEKVIATIGVIVLGLIRSALSADTSQSASRGAATHA